MFDTLTLKLTISSKHLLVYFRDSKDDVSSRSLICNHTLPMLSISSNNEAIVSSFLRLTNYANDANDASDTTGDEVLVVP